MKTCSLLGSVVLLIYLGWSSLGLYLPPGHQHGSEVVISSVCAQVYRHAHPHQHRVRLDAHGSLIWHSVYTEDCSVTTLSRKGQRQDASRQLLPVMYRYGQTGKQVASSSCCSCCCLSQYELAPRCVSVWITPTFRLVGEAGHASAIYHPPKTMLSLFV
jgi:hypothetical protein